jgi:hypothetical protein
MVHITVSRIMVIRTGGTDKVALDTTLPSGVWPYEGVATVYLDLARGSAEDYLAKNFSGVPFEVVGS